MSYPPLYRSPLLPDFSGQVTPLPPPSKRRSITLTTPKGDIEMPWGEDRDPSQKEINEFISSQNVPEKSTLGKVKEFVLDTPVLDTKPFFKKLAEPVYQSAEHPDTGYLQGKGLNVAAAATESLGYGVNAMLTPFNLATMGIGEISALYGAAAFRGIPAAKETIDALAQAKAVNNVAEIERLGNELRTIAQATEKANAVGRVTHAVNRVTSGAMAGEAGYKGITEKDPSQLLPFALGVAGMGRYRPRMESVAAPEIPPEKLKNTFNEFPYEGQNTPQIKPLLGDPKLSQRGNVPPYRANTTDITPDLALGRSFGEDLIPPQSTWTPPPVPPIVDQSRMLPEASQVFPPPQPARFTGADGIMMDRYSPSIEPPIRQGILPEDSQNPYRQATTITGEVLPPRRQQLPSETVEGQFARLPQSMEEMVAEQRAATEKFAVSPPRGTTFLSLPSRKVEPLAPKNNTELINAEIVRKAIEDKTRQAAPVVNPVKEVVPDIAPVSEIPPTPTTELGPVPKVDQNAATIQSLRSVVQSLEKSGQGTSRAAEELRGKIRDLVAKNQGKLQSGIDPTFIFDKAKEVLAKFRAKGKNNPKLTVLEQAQLKLQNAIASGGEKAIERAVYNLQSATRVAEQEMKIPSVEGQTVYHGTRTAEDLVKEGFNPTKNKTLGGDFLDWMTHFSPESEQANEYSSGFLFRRRGEGNAGTIPTRLKIKNPIDLDNPSQEMMDKVFNAIPEWQRKSMIRRRAIESGDNSDALYAIFHEITPEQFKKTGFDGVSFAEGKYWAVPNLSQIEGKFTRAPLDRYNKPVSQINKELAKVPKIGEMGSGINPLKILSKERIQDIKDRPFEYANVSRAIQASMDLSFPFRQGLFLAHKKEFWQSFEPMIKSMASEKGYVTTQKLIRDHPLFEQAKKDGISFTELGKEMSEREDAFRSSVAEQLPAGIGTVIKRSGAAYSAFGNHLRMQTYANLIQAAELAGENVKGNENLRKQIANFVNTASGRGSLDIGVMGNELVRNSKGELIKQPKAYSAEPAAELLGQVFFSPRLIASRLKMIGNQPISYAYWQKDPFVRKQYLKAWLGFMAGQTAILGTAKLAGADVTLDPTNPDFMKAKWGRTRLDMAGGMSQYFVAASQIAWKMKTSSITGKVSLLNTGKFGAPTGKDVLYSFMEKKAAPITSFMLDALEGKDFKGNKFEVQRALWDRLHPMITQDLIDLMNEDPKLLPLIIPAVMGGSLQTYSSNPFNKASKSNLTNVPRIH